LVCAGLAALLLGAALGEALEGNVAEPGIQGLRMPFDFAPGASGGVAVLEDLSRRIVLVRDRGRQTPLPGVAHPKVLAADEGGLLLVLDAQAGARPLLVGFRNGREEWRAWIQGDEFPADPVGMDARDGIVWVADRSPPRLLLYAYDGASLGWVDLAKWARSVFSVALGPDGQAFVTDPLGPSVLAFSPTGSYLGPLDVTDTGVTRPTGIAVDPMGRVWVSDGVTGRVVCFGPSGERSGVSCAGKFLRFEDPLRLAWREGALWVLEGNPGRVQRVELEKP
jgi:DNA-binding beta-propeller fold protein YncE